jgi:dienelactone hydrolase
VLTFDYKGWGDSDGAKTRLAPYSRVADVQAALTFIGAQPEVDVTRLGIYGTSYGGATVVFVAPRTASSAVPKALQQHVVAVGQLGVAGECA